MLKVSKNQIHQFFFGAFDSEVCFCLSSLSPQGLCQGCGLWTPFMLGFWWSCSNVSHFGFMPHACSLHNLGLTLKSMQSYRCCSCMYYSCVTIAQKCTLYLQVFFPQSVAILPCLKCMVTSLSFWVKMYKSLRFSFSSDVVAISQMLCVHAVACFAHEYTLCGIMFTCNIDETSIKMHVAIAAILKIYRL